MGMSATIYNARANQITRSYYNQLISEGKKRLVYTKQQQNGTTIYFLSKNT